MSLLLRYIVIVFVEIQSITARTTYYQSFDRLVRGGEEQNQRSKFRDIDRENKYSKSLQQSLSSHSLSGSTLNSQSVGRKSLYSLRDSVGDQRTLGSVRQSLRSVGASSKSLEMGDTASTLSGGQGGPHQTIVVKTGGGSISKILNSEAAKAAATAFGATSANLAAKAIENRFSREPDPSPGYQSCPPYGYCR